MSESSIDVLRYRRNHFSTRLPVGHRYTRSHFWLAPEDPANASTGRVWRIGLTGFATRMLGEIVELELEIAPDAPVEVAQTVGWIEGFKAVSDLICVARGRFRGSNPEIEADRERVCARPYTDGWLYRVEGVPDPDAVDVHGYVDFLDATIDKMLEQPWRKASTPGSEPER